MSHAVRMHIDKFGGEVLIEHDHPLAVAQRAKGTAKAPASGDAAPEYGKMRNADLLELATKRGLDIPEGATKAVMVAALEAADLAAKQASDGE